MENLNCEIELFIRIIEEKIFCKCNLKVDVVIVEGSFEEIELFLKRSGKCKDKEIREKLKSNILHYMRLLTLGGKQTKHKRVYLIKSLVRSSIVKLKRKLGKKLYEECERALGDVGDDVDRSLIINSLIKAREYSKSKSGGLLILLTTDEKLSEKVISVASRSGLLTHITLPSLGDINKCLSVDCYMKCILECTLRGCAE
jgi:hypothetical protein